MAVAISAGGLTACAGGGPEAAEGDAVGEDVPGVGDCKADAGVSSEVAVGVSADAAPDVDGVADAVGVTIGVGMDVAVPVGVGDDGCTRFRFALRDAPTDGLPGDADAAVAAPDAGAAVAAAGIGVSGAASVPGIEVSPIVGCGFGISMAPGCAVLGSVGSVDISPGAAVAGSSFGAASSEPAGSSADGAGFSSSGDIGIVVASSARWPWVSTVPGDSAGTSIVWPGVPAAGVSPPADGEEGDEAPLSNRIALAVTWY